MPKRDADILIDDIKVALGRIDSYLTGLDREGFLKDQKTIDAVVRNLEIVGEAVRWLPDDFKSRYADVPWTLISGLRNRIVHDYFGLDLEIIWQVLQVSLPEFKQQLGRIPTW